MTPRTSATPITCTTFMSKWTGWSEKFCPPSTTTRLLMICSDHGFAQFGRQLHLNTWLRDNGYLVMKSEAAKKEKTNILDIDWSKTLAYGIGFNGLYINQEGREWSGIVGPQKREELVQRISAELQGITDGETGRKPVDRVYRQEEVYSGDFTYEMPTCWSATRRVYRSSSSSVLGETGQVTLDVNPYAWSGDHSMSRDRVPGTLFSSRSISKARPSILDLPVSILDHFGIEKPADMVGETIYRG